MRAIGLDMSITCAGVAIVHLTSAGLHYQTVKRVTSAPGKGSDALRYHHICEEISDIICLRPTDLVFIEEYAYGANGQITRIAELGGTLRYKILVEQEFDYARWFEVGPSALKKFIVGKGNAAKEQVIKEVYKRYGYDAADNNEADALSLAMLGGTLMNMDNVEPAKYQREAIEAVLKRNKVTHEQFRRLIPAKTTEPTTAGAAKSAPSGPRRRPSTTQPSGPADGQGGSVCTPSAPTAPTRRRLSAGPAPDVPGLFQRRIPVQSKE